MRPSRVVSLLPSATEVLCACGGEDLLVGRSHECDWPPSILDRPVLTAPRTRASASADIDAEVRASLSANESLYVLDAALLASLEPDVILTQDLCDVCSIDLKTVRALAGRLPRTPTIVSLDPHELFDVFDDLLRVGAAVGREESAERAMVELRDRYWRAVDFVNPYISGPEVAFLEWADPIFVGGHWTPGLIEAAGGRHSLNPKGARSRRIDPEDLVAAHPERIVLCPCGLGLERARADYLELTRTRWWQFLPAVMDPAPRRVAIVDGNQMFNRPGPRLVDAFEWLVAWLQGREELAPEGFPVLWPDESATAAPRGSVRA